ncbi:MAG: NAD(P)/FAD-dependent oxidoreductase [Pseudomonadota bacterium]
MPSLLTRRVFSTGLATALCTPTILRGDPATDTDVVVIGAGVAGLTAAHQLMGRSVRTTVLEARDRVGGRAWTDSHDLGLPFDQGAHWLHNAEVNVFATHAARLGLPLKDASTENRVLYQGGETLDQAEANRLFEQAERRLNRRLLFRAVFGGDTDLASLQINDFWQTALIGIAAFSMAANPSDISFDDFAALEDGEERTVQGGYGALIARVFAQVPVRLGHEVTALDWSRAGVVRVSGSWGVLSARRVIIAVPPTVLASGAIRFTPALPEPKERAIGSFVTGQFLKVGLKLAEPANGLAEYHADVADLAGGRREVLVADQFDPMLTLITSGDTARDLGDEPLSAREAYAKERVAGLLGADFARKIAGKTSYNWAEDPFAMGSFSALAPGSRNAREEFVEPLGNLVHFAGDAAPTPYAVTVLGAYQSGLSAAQNVLSSLAG